ncbi:excinuclease ABC subunit UvrA [Candidatus Bathyarchaeota archaeon]|nr:excinuclease ABC subunit UvrA [Candidatus Bathyarchaeota archaeon]
MKNITIKGAHIHNLKNINVTIPKNTLTVATGVSGSGKSSLVFDIIFEEGRRQYLRSLGILAGIEDEAKFDSISGIGPTIAVQQSVIRQSNPRSTVGTRTGILNILAVLYAVEGQPTCIACKTPVDSRLTCPKCGSKEERLPASYFSYNAPNGMCPKCSGRGATFEINMEKLVPDNQMTLQDVFNRVNPTPGYANLLQKRFKEHLKMRFSELPDEVKADVLYGHFVESNYDKRSYCLTRILQGGLYRNHEVDDVYAMTVCSSCHGFRVGEEAQSVRLNGKHIGELGKLIINELQGYVEDLAQGSFTGFGKNLIKEIKDKTDRLVKARLGHLSLYREMPTLSGGEIQRLFLNAHLDSKMDSLIYILDEPTVGLHESEKAELLTSIKALKELGNTVIVVEHDENTIAMAEHVIDIGPKAGVEGGQVIYQGDYKGLLECEASITGQYLSGKAAMPSRTSRLNQQTAKSLTINHAKTNNLKDVTVAFPLGCLVGVAGVSGSGKSSLVSDTLVPLLKNYFHDEPPNNVENPAENGDETDTVIETVAEKLEGTEHLSGYAEVSQAPIGRNITSNPASYIGIWDKIRKLFASQPDALKLGLTAGHFSFNSDGACAVCKGSGNEKIWLGGDTFIDKVCSRCHGERYNDEALSVKYKGKSIFDVLEMSVSEAVGFFEDQPAIAAMLKILDRIGMGYIELGQPTPTLSGGESQRVKLAKEIGRRRKGNILYMLDEPTTGLSLYDTAKLIQLLDELVAKGNSVLVIEHDPQVLSVCDWIVELGPKGGAEGGRVIAEGTPRELKNNPQSVTGAYLHPR